MTRELRLWWGESCMVFSTSTRLRRITHAIRESRRLRFVESAGSQDAGLRLLALFGGLSACTQSKGGTASLICSRYAGVRGD